MNLARLTSPDYALGKALIGAKSLADLGLLLLARPEAESLRLARWIVRLKPFYTMVSNRNLVGLARLIGQLDRLGLPGAVVECGVWNGGASALLAATHLRARPQLAREFWLFDSFQGLPPPGGNDGARLQAAYFEGWCTGDPAAVRRALALAGLPPERAHIVPGWFDATLPQAQVGPIALLHIDADWYDSVLLVLRTLFDRVAPGGVVVLNDYGFWQGCDRAVQDFLAERGLSHLAIRQIDPKGGAFFQKPAAP